VKSARCRPFSRGKFDDGLPEQAGKTGRSEWYGRRGPSVSSARRCRPPLIAKAFLTLMDGRKDMIIVVASMFTPAIWNWNTQHPDLLESRDRRAYAQLGEKRRWAMPYCGPVPQGATPRILTQWSNARVGKRPRLNPSALQPTKLPAVPSGNKVLTSRTNCATQVQPGNYGHLQLKSSGNSASTLGANDRNFVSARMK